MAQFLQPLFAPRRDFPGGVYRRPGFDPHHPAVRAYSSNFLSVIATPGGIINLNKAGIVSVASGSQTLGIKSVVGPVTVNAPQYNLPGGTSNPSGGVTMATIFYLSSVLANSVILGMNQGNSGGYRIDSGTDGAHFSFTMPNVVAIAGPSISAGVPYFCAASGVGGGSIYFLVLNLATGAVTTSSTTTASNPNSPGGFVFGTLAGFQSSIVGGIAAACCIPKQLGPAELLAWAADPWSFWYQPIKSLMLVGTTPAFKAAWALNRNFLSEGVAT